MAPDSTDADLDYTLKVIRNPIYRGAAATGLIVQRTDEKLYSLREAAVLSGVSRRMMSRAIKDGELTAPKLQLAGSTRAPLYRIAHADLEKSPSPIG